MGRFMEMNDLGLPSPPKRCVYDKKFLLINPGGLPESRDVYIYILNNNGCVRAAVEAIARNIMPSGEEVRFVTFSYAKDGNIEWPAKVISKSEYETWHEFDKA